MVTSLTLLRLLGSSAADVSMSPPSESQNRLLNNEQDANSIGGHVEKSGEHYRH